ncbi:bifunctional 2-polyprenyl-6-hydroxyphenol methylase/3-demethylubiquinol 3-O-methyltransferase UbiG [Rickettsia endosymbiont of Cardiosporidium cionae]|uniref:bifunctional 2-polyprenyl-6-hydroxyphenol methylase/3-demethylubiquinol 3-O-methyltransferase UbiG n=1 Tax=Rickettsia endosymbiont of Cardiosporidium cionae TaxID=2777155 RepID=UPI001894D207|nr:bifunctional 2-polyprenyl-6-hydroxyphenol methylase/3-demethylubiquinol 3-O-methyltransferase UbiG [Rickettsia endosymbiont of Cardiosporidium cionae]KAF8818394.1 bifunctional 2-polyprenyl-6-hydroxyphenol methylase/3-demethylubiquinol 3-O-methyltransferase UbiG [Rickettsia endosymbiont of Cardiosporidium cionae]
MDESSIDDIELAKFNKNYDQWWDPKSEFSILHKIHPVRVEYLFSTLTSYFNTSDCSAIDVVDIGCGGGLISSSLAKKGFNVIGIDPSESNIASARHHCRLHNLSVTYLCSSIEDYLKLGKKFHVVLCLEVVEHVSNIQKFILNLSSLVESNGVLIISTINRNIKSYIYSILIGEYVLRWLPRNTHNYSKFIKPSELNMMLKTTNLKLVKLNGLNFNILHNQWFISDDVDVNYFAVFK